MKGKPKLQKKIISGGYKIIKMPVWIDTDSNELQIGGEVYSLSKAKDYLLRYYEDLINKYRLRVLYDSKGKARILYAWESIIAEAIEKEILPYSSSSLQYKKKPSTRTIHLILTGEGR
jgi:hypothetical protein